MPYSLFINAFYGHNKGIQAYIITLEREIKGFKMSRVYITNASMNLIVRSLRKKDNTTNRDFLISNIAYDLSEDGIFSKNDLNDFFNTNDLKDIYNMKMVLKDFQDILNNINGNKDIITKYVESENKKYAYSVKAPAYHNNKSCQWMKQAFRNIKIPQNCLSNENNEKKVREWIDKNHNLSFEKLNNKFIEEFKCAEGLKQISLENSGTIDFENYKVEFKGQLKQCHLQLRFLLDGEFGDKIANYRYAPKFKIDNIVKFENNINLHKPIIDFHTAKNELQKILFDFYKNKYNADLSFEKSILDSIGFNQCKGCIH